MADSVMVILPCPFCWPSAVCETKPPYLTQCEETKEFSIHAPCCDFHGPSFDSAEKAVSTWNNRSPIPGRGLPTRADAEGTDLIAEWDFLRYLGTTEASYRVALNKHNRALLNLVESYREDAERWRFLQENGGSGYEDHKLCLARFYNAGSIHGEIRCECADNNAAIDHARCFPDV